MVPLLWFATFKHGSTVRMMKKHVLAENSGSQVEQRGVRHYGLKEGVRHQRLAERSALRQLQ
jgi:hypothetical protein